MNHARPDPWGPGAGYRPGLPDQFAVSVHYVSPGGHDPLDMRLDLPESWLGDTKRLDKAGVPEAERRPLTKGEIALELLDRVRGEGLPGGLVVADSGYGVSGPFRDGLAGGTGLPADEGRTRAGSPRGAVVAGFPPPRLPGDAGLRVPHPGATSSPPRSVPAGQKGGCRAPVITLPSIRRALVRLLAPVSRHDCSYCRPWLAQGKLVLTE